MTEEQFIISKACPDLSRQLNFLDMLLRMGEEAEEVSYEVSSCSKKAAQGFGVWLASRNKKEETGIFPQMIPALFEHIYLDNCSRQASLKNITKSSLQDYLEKIEFNISQSEWDQGLNPYQAILDFYTFLEKAGYDGNLKRRKNAVNQIKRKITKKPMVSKEVH